MEQTILKDSSHSWDGTSLPCYPAGIAKITVSKVTISVGEKTDWHEHELIYAGFILSGELTIISQDGSSITVESGEAVVEITSKLHYGENRGKVPVEIVVFRAGCDELSK